MNTTPLDADEKWREKFFDVVELDRVSALSRWRLQAPVLLVLLKDSIAIGVQR